MVRGMKNQFRWLAVSAFLWWSFSSHAAPLTVGDALPAFSAKDQFGRDFNSTNHVRFLLVATEMSSAKAANQMLAAQGGDFLGTNHAAYLMDIHTMPAAARWFAIPKMKKYPQRIVLVDSAETLTDFPVRPGCVTVLALTAAGRIQKISFWNPNQKSMDDYLK